MVMAKMPIAVSKHNEASSRKIIPRPRAKSGPTEDTLRQCGHRANALVCVLNCERKSQERSGQILCECISRSRMNILTRNVSLQWAQVTRHIPGTDDTGGVTGLGAKLMIRLQLGRGQAMRCDELLQINRQLHGQRTYFLPGGALRMGYIIKIHNCFYPNASSQIPHTYRCLAALSAFDDVLLPLAAYVDHGVAHAARYHRDAALSRLLVRRRQLIGSYRRNGR